MDLPDCIDSDEEMALFIKECHITGVPSLLFDKGPGCGGRRVKDPLWAHTVMLRLSSLCRVLYGRRGGKWVKAGSWRESHSGIERADGYDERDWS